jgi:hypothetical protein
MSKLGQRDLSHGTAEIRSYDDYLATYLPQLREKQASDQATPQEFGVTMARRSLQRIREALGRRASSR